MASRIRCRFAGRSYNIWARQCPNPAKGERVVNVETGDKVPACGVHLNAGYVNVYVPREGSKYEPPIQTEVRR